VVSKVSYFIGKAGPMVGSFIGKVAPIVRNIGKFMNNRSDRLGPMGKPLNGVASGVDSVV
jgi:hypothetical protein